MPMESHDKLQIALLQLETALGLFLRGGERYSVITLAGAADEILGKMLESRGGVSALASLTRASVAINEIVAGPPGNEKMFAERANLARNSLKHLKAGGNPSVDLDTEEEAVDMLDRAISNYWELTARLSPQMEAFEHRRRAT